MSNTERRPHTNRWLENYKPMQEKEWRRKAIDASYRRHNDEQPEDTLVSA
jgi:aminoglycoside/choline kinase family phosphotransferase